MSASTSTVQPTARVTALSVRCRSRSSNSKSPSGTVASRRALACTPGRSITASTRLARLPGVTCPGAVPGPFASNRRGREGAHMVAEVSRLVAVDPRVVWPSEAADFTPWLRDNADALADALGLDLELTATEHQVGPFFLDVIGRDLTNDSVLVVENQLGPTDHDHLGKLLTYAANTDAATIVWMAVSFREEHRQAIEFLNELGGEKARFFGIEIGAARIGGSLPAPLFKVVAQPNEFHAQAAAAAKVSSEPPGGKGALYAEFWERFLEQLKARHPGWTRV